MASLDHGFANSFMLLYISGILLTKDVHRSVCIECLAWGQVFAVTPAVCLLDTNLCEKD